MKKISKFIIYITLLSSVTAFAAPLTNPGFETGDFNGWTLSHPSASTVVTTWTGDGDAGGSTQITYTPQDGNYFAVLAAGGGDGIFTMASQPFSLGVGESISGFAAFDFRDTYDSQLGLYNDSARVRILNNLGVEVAVPWERRGSDSDVIDYWDGPWETWSFTANQAGSYQIEYGAANFGDNDSDSRALFDMAVPASVPDAGGTMMMLSCALGLMAFLGRRNRL